MGVLRCPCHLITFCSDGVLSMSQRDHILLFADDVVLIEETESALQRSLDTLSNYCRASGLVINTSKTKIVIFNRKHVRNRASKPFILSKCEIQISKEYNGLVLRENGSINISALANQANKALLNGNPKPEVSKSINYLLSLRYTGTPNHGVWR